MKGLRHSCSVAIRNVLNGHEKSNRKKPNMESYTLQVSTIWGVHTTLSSLIKGHAAYSFQETNTIQRKQKIYLTDLESIDWKPRNPTDIMYITQYLIILNLNGHDSWCTYCTYICISVYFVSFSAIFLTKLLFITLLHNAHWHLWINTIFIAIFSWFLIASL